MTFPFFLFRLPQGGGGGKKGKRIQKLSGASAEFQRGVPVRMKNKIEAGGLFSNILHN